MNGKIRFPKYLIVASAMLVAGQPATAATHDRMTRAKVEEYERCFSAQQRCFAKIYAPDVVFPHVTGGMLRGPEQIADFYEAMWKTGVHEVREINALAIDNSGGTMMVEEKVRFFVKPGFETVTLPSGEVMKQGETWKGGAVMVFGLKNGKVNSVRGSILGPGAITRVTQ